MKNIAITLAVLVISSVALTAQEDVITYDDNGRIEQVRYANGQEIRYSYDKRGNITSINEVIASVSEEKVEEIALVVRPNPATDKITVEAPASRGTKATFTVLTMDGKKVFSASILPDVTERAVLEIDVDKHGLASGTYLVVVETARGRGSSTLGIID